MKIKEIPHRESEYDIALSDVQNWYTSLRSLPMTSSNVRNGFDGNMVMHNDAVNHSPVATIFSVFMAMKKMLSWHYEMKGYYH